MNKALLYLTLTNTSLVHAASFDCAKASTTIEKSICSSEEISLIDEQMAKAYKDKRWLLSKSDRGPFLNSQKLWLKLRNECSSTSDVDECLYNSYQNRIIAINSYTPENKSLQYKIRWNEYLPLCQEILGILNSYPISFFVAPNSVFEDARPNFSPVKLQPTNKPADLPEGSKVSNFYLSQPVDANHDGILERFSVWEHPNKDTYSFRYVFRELNPTGKLKTSEDSITFSATDAFLYKGRFYLISIGKIVAVNEPSLPWGEKSGFRENAEICQYQLQYQ